MDQNKVLRQGLYAGVFAIIFVIGNAYFYLFNRNSFEGLIALLLMGILFLKEIRLEKRYHQIYSFFIFFTVITFLSMAKLIIGGYQNVYTAIKNYIPCFLVLSAVPFMDSRMSFCRKAIITFSKLTSYILVILLVIQQIIYPSLIFLPNIVSQRNQLRVLSGPFLLVTGLILTYCDFVKDKRYKLLRIFAMGLIVYAIFFINQSRSVDLAVGLTFMLTFRNQFLKKIRNEKVNHLVVNTITVLIFVLFILYAMTLLGNSLAIEEASSVVRINEILCYFNLLGQNPLLGIGHEDPSFPAALGHLAYLQLYCVNDIGIVGYWAEFGGAGILCSAWIFKILFSVAKISERTKMFLLFFVFVAPFNFILYADFTVFLPIVIMVAIEDINRHENASMQTQNKA